jgi:molybdopterin-guanine dinucleotide biosynthesis protein
MTTKEDNDNKTIFTAEGDPIPWLNKDVNNHLDKTTLIFGGSGSGKTTIVEEIMYQLKDHIPNFLVVAPRTSDIAYRRKLPARCIKEDLTKKKLQQIWKRQFDVTQLYNTANDINVLEDLFKKAPDRDSIVLLEGIKRISNKYIRDVDSSNADFGKKKAQKTAMEELAIKKTKSLYKEAIRKNKHILERMDLLPREKIALEYLDLNPRFCLIIDDCSELFSTWMKYFKKDEPNPFECMLYKGRWNYMTLVIAAHDDKLIDSKLRKNSRVTIYTNSQSLVASISKTANGFTPKEKRESMRYATRIFGEEKDGIKTYQKLCYVREDNQPFKYTIANQYPDFSLGCDPLKSMASKMSSKEDNLVSNPYVKDLFKKEKYD